MLRCVVKEHKQLHNSALCEPKLFLTQLPRLICTLRPALPFGSLPRFLMNISCEVSYKLWGLLQLTLWGRMAKPAFSSLALIVKQRRAQTAGKASRQLGSWAQYSMPRWSRFQWMSLYYLIKTLQKHSCQCSPYNSINIDQILTFHIFLNSIQRNTESLGMHEGIVNLSFCFKGGDKNRLSAAVWTTLHKYHHS